VYFVGLLYFTEIVHVIHVTAKVRLISALCSLLCIEKRKRREGIERKEREWKGKSEVRDKKKELEIRPPHCEVYTEPVIAL